MPHSCQPPRLGPPASGITSIDIDGRFSIFNPRTQRVLTLNETASDVWRLCDGQWDLADIVDTLAAAYSESADSIRSSVHDTVRLFDDEGLLEAHPE